MPFLWFLCGSFDVTVSSYSGMGSWVCIFFSVCFCFSLFGLLLVVCFLRVCCYCWVLFSGVLLIRFCWLVLVDCVYVGVWFVVSYVVGVAFVFAWTFVMLVFCSLGGLMGFDFD